MRVMDKRILSLLQDILKRWGFALRKELLGPNAIGKFLEAGIHRVCNIAGFSAFFKDFD